MEVPAKLMVHLAKDGLAGEVVNLMPPIVQSPAVATTSLRAKRWLNLRLPAGGAFLIMKPAWSFPTVRGRTRRELILDSISYEDLTELINSFQREALRVEMRDSYGTAAEIPHLAKWEAGEPDDPAWLQPRLDRVRAGVAAGKVFRRARIVSEPVFGYQRWVLKDSHLFVEAGEDIRWVPRPRVSTVALPGNVFRLSDNQIAVFLIFAGNGMVVDRQKNRGLGGDRFVSGRVRRGVGTVDSRQ